MTLPAIAVGPDQKLEGCTPPLFIPVADANRGKKESATLSLASPAGAAAGKDGKPTSAGTAAASDAAVTSNSIRIPLSGIQIGVGIDSTTSFTALWKQEWPQGVPFLVPAKGSSFLGWGGDKSDAELPKVDVVTAMFNMETAACTSRAIQLVKEASGATAGLEFPALKFSAPIVKVSVPTIPTVDRRAVDPTPGAQEAAKAVARAVEDLVGSFEIPAVSAGASVLKVASGFAHSVTKSLMGKPFNAVYAPGDLFLSIE